MTEICECCGQPGGVCRRCGLAHTPCEPLPGTGNPGCEVCSENEKRLRGLFAVVAITMDSLNERRLR